MIVWSAGSKEPGKKLPWLPALILVVVAIGMTVTGCGGGSGSATAGDQELEVVAHSTPGAAYEEFLEPAFQAVGRGAGVGFSNSFGEWETQSKALKGGQPASIVQVPTASDMEALVESGLVSKAWRQQRFRGIAQRSVIVIMTREGNPLNIKSFDDLFEQDVEVILPNPFSSDAGRWNIMAVYGSQLRGGKSKAEALARIASLLEKAPEQPATDRTALTAFLQGKGDALVGYESEAIAAQKVGKGLEYVIPRSTIMVESPIAATEDAPPEARAFLDFMWSTAGQETWTMAGFRPVKVYVLSVVQFPTPEDLFKIDALGGWDQVEREFFDPQTGVIAKFERQLGVPTDG